jgi:hypothetical protein
VGRVSRIRTKRAWPIIALLLFCVAFWVSADLFHGGEKAGEDSATCPICHFARLAGSGAPVVGSVLPIPSFVAVGSPPELLIPPAPMAVGIGSWSPRGPPPSA